MSGWPVLSILTFLPLAGAMVVMLGTRGGAARKVAGLFHGLVLAGVVVLALGFETTTAGLQFEERRAWVPTLGVEYRLGVDGLGMVGVLLAGLIPLMASLMAGRVAVGRESLFHGLLLGLQAGLMGTFTALNFFHWFLYWELSLVPAYLLVRLFGGVRAGPAAFQFFVYTMVGSVALLLGFLALRAAGGSFDFLELAEFGRSGRLTQALAEALPWAGGLGSGEWLGYLVFGGVLLGLAVKVPMWPFHTWLPDAYTEAPNGVTMVLTGVMSKMGLYGLMRIGLPIFPEQFLACQGWLIGLALVTVIWPAWVACAQGDLKRMLAYSSVNHLGYCLLALFVVMPVGGGEAWVNGVSAPALNGVLLQMFNHGLTAAMLFAGLEMLERRTGGVRDLSQFGGLRRVAPVYCGLMGIGMFASLGMPGLNGFVSEFLMFRGVFGAAPWVAAAATLGLLGTAVFLLGAMQRWFHGPVEGRSVGFADLTTGERWMLGMPVVLMGVLGVYPDLLLRMTNATVVGWAGGGAGW
jgi:NADH-quinone oxidoreductase subunit M